MKLIAGALFLGLASAASAVTLVGGGATLPVIGYTKVATGTPITAPVAGSLFAVYNAAHGTTISYCPTGSGAGKKILAGNVAGATVNDACPSGFGAAASLGLTQPHFAGSDAPMSLSEYNAYLSGHGNSLPTQLPSIAGAVGIVFKKSGVNSLTLNEDQICGVFSGRLKTWQDLRADGAIGIPTTTTGDINVAFRSDGSGTTFSLLNHLSFVCPNVAHPQTSFGTIQTYTTGASAYLGNYASSFGGNGNAGVIAVVAGTAPGVPTTDGSIGYAEVANGVTGGVRIASVTNTGGTTVNPATGFGPTAVPVTLTFDRVIADLPDPLTGRPVLSALPNGATSNGCLAVVNPDSYANPGSAAGSTAYPIVAVTNFLSNSSGTPAADLADTRGLLASPYDTTIRSSVTSIGRIGTGYAWLSSSDLTAARVNSCVN